MSRPKSQGPRWRRTGTYRPEPLEQRWLLSVNPTANHVFERGGYLTAPAEGEAIEVASDYLRAHAADLGLGVGDVSQFVVTDQYTDAHNSLTHLYLRQTLNGLEIDGADANVNVTADGQILNVGSRFLSNVMEAKTVSTTPELSAAEAAQAAAKAWNLKLEGVVTTLDARDSLDRSTTLRAPGLSLDDVPAKLHYVYDSETQSVRLAWNLVARTPDGEHWYDASIDAIDGRLLDESDWIDHATYNVFPIPTEAPNDGVRSIVTDPHDLVASPYGWHDTNGSAGAEFIDTRGNNVNAQEDADANNSGGARPSGGPALNFDFPFDPATQPVTYVNSTTTNLFYWNNILHDVHYQYGFTESAGSFQVNNYGRGGLGNDAVNADDRDGSGTNNANFGTPPDGAAPRMQMYEFTATSPRRSSSFDNLIIIHEYGHGVSNRLTGGPGNASALDAWQSGGMGEGWGDWWGLMLTQKPVDVVDGAYPVGTYVLGETTSGSGIRRLPYSYDMSINNQTLGWYNSSNEVHDAGELWCSVLWDVNWLLVQKHGYDPDVYNGDGGNNLALQLVMDGLKLQPANPSFIEARDAILLADQALTGGANQLELWTAFARRGWGLSASSGADANSSTVVEAFDMPDLSLKVLSATPGHETYTNQAITAFTLNFDAAIAAGSIDLTDFSVDGVHPTSFQLVDADTVTFEYAVSPASAQGPHTMSLPADSILRASDNDGVNGFEGVFYRDNLEMLVTSTTPTHLSSVTLPLTTVQFDFNEAYGAASIGIDDLALSDGHVTSFALVDANSVAYTIAGTSHEGTLSVELRAGAVTDAHGSPLPTAHELTFQADIGTVDFPGPFEVLGPTSAMVYDPALAATIGSSSDVDGLAIELEAGTVLSVVVDPDTVLRPIITVRDEQLNVLATVSASVVGETIFVSGVPAPDGGGVLTVSVSSAAGSTGAYTTKFTINADLEAEGFTAVNNDTRAAAEPLTSWVSVPEGGQRSTIVGQADSSLESEPNNNATSADNITAVFGAYSGSRYQLSVNGSYGTGSDADWYKLGTFQPGDVLTVSASGVSSSQGTHTNPAVELYRGAVKVDDDDNEGPGNDAVVYRYTVTTGGEYYARVHAATPTSGTYRFSAWLENQGSAPTAGPGAAAEAEPNDTRQTANDASALWAPVTYRATVGGSITAADTDYYRFALSAGDVVTVVAHSTSALDAQIALRNSSGGVLASENGTSLRVGPDSWVFSYPILSTGNYHLSVTTAAGNGGYVAEVYRSTSASLPVPTVGFDYYSLDMAADEVVDLAVGAFPSDGTVSLWIEDSSGATLAEGLAGGSFDHVIRDFTPPAAGTYYLRVGSGTAPYTLVVNRGPHFDSDANETFETALDITARESAVGAVTDGSSPIQAESEPNGDVPTADDLRGSFASMGAGQFRATVTGTVSTNFDGDWDYFRIHAKPGDTLTVALNADSEDLDPLVRLFNSAGSQIDEDDDSGPSTDSLLTFSDFTYEGDYYIVADSWGYTEGPYTLIATLATDRISPRLDEDYYQFEVTAGEPIYLSTSTPFDAPGEPGNGLDPVLYLYDPSGALVASDDNSAADGRNARVSVVAAQSGFYRARVAAAPGTSGGYVLSALADVEPPSIASVAVGSSVSTHSDYTIPTGSGEQLRTVGLALVDTIFLTFGEDVVVEMDDLTVSGQSTPSYAISGFSYDPATYVATWTLATPIVADEITLALSDDVVDAAGNALDGEFDNPTDLADPTSDVTPGDGTPGGDFEFRLTVLSADGNRDNVVNGADFTIWSDGFGSIGAELADGDYSGDGIVDGADFTVWSDLFGTDHTVFALAPPDSGAVYRRIDDGGEPAGSLAPPTRAPLASLAASAFPAARTQEETRRARSRAARSQVDFELFGVERDWLRGE